MSAQPSDTCLFCGITRQEVNATRMRDGYTLGCGIESNTEAGFDYEELSPRHRWAAWRDLELHRMGIKPEAFEKYRNSRAFSIQYAACEDTVIGHLPSEGTEEDRQVFGTSKGQCITCGKKDVA